jgi:hypothetical protein
MAMSGKNQTLKEIYEKQIEFQNEVINNVGYNIPNSEELKSIPCDNIPIASYHVQAMAEEFGELVKSDKRWKNYRNSHYDKANKLVEISDCFITLMNIAIFSGFSSDEFEKALQGKIKKNFERIK